MAYRYRIDSMTFNDGTEVSLSDLTVIVGPNNAGKSRVLKDLCSLAIGERKKRVVLSKITWPQPPGFSDLLKSYDLKPNLEADDGSWSAVALASDLSKQWQVGFGHEWDAQARRTTFEAVSPADPSPFATWFGTRLVMMLTTEQRLQLVKTCNSPSGKRQLSHVLHALYAGGKNIETVVRAATKKSFGLEVALDFTALTSMKLRLGPDFSKLPEDPRTSASILESCDELDDQGDGIRSFVGIIAALLTSDRPVALVDEPETFLHPPQAYAIGEFLADRAVKGRQVIVATHSADTLRGILNTKKDVTIIRLDRNGASNRPRVLSTADVEVLSKDPLLSSSRVFEGLFYRGVAVVEADADARIYQAATRKRDSSAELHFVNADNKQTIPKIINAYRKVGVKACGVVDFDVLNDPAELRKQLEAFQLDATSVSRVLEIRGEIADHISKVDPTARVAAVAAEAKKLADTVTALSKLDSVTQRAEIEKSLRTIESDLKRAADTTKQWKTFKERGRDALPSELQVKFDELVALCDQKGLILNVQGQLESVLVDCGLLYSTDKKLWISSAMTMVPNLQVNDSLKIWKLAQRIIDGAAK